MDVRGVLLSAVLTLLMLHTAARSLPSAETSMTSSQGNASNWSPAWLQKLLDCRGMPCTEYDKMQQSVSKILQLQAEMQSKAAGDPVDGHPLVRPLPAENGTLDGCIWLTSAQADAILQDEMQALQARMDAKRRRHTRKLDVSVARGWTKWTQMPIQYKFDGKHSAREQDSIRGAFQHWMHHTCVRFEEVPLPTKLTSFHLLVSAHTTGCHSYVGRVGLKPQIINLQSSCLWQFGIAVHEIGHSLGLWHEQQRRDRDDHVIIHYDNLAEYKGQFNTRSTQHLGVPYDPQSVMHYSSKDGSGNGQRTIEHRDPLFTQSFGQRTGLSFYDAKIINAAYCADTCKDQPLAQPCRRGGYQDPNHCSGCRCMDGWSGAFCEELAPEKNDACGGKLQATYTPQRLQSPGYGGRLYYKDHT